MGLIPSKERNKSPKLIVPSINKSLIIRNVHLLPIIPIGTSIGHFLFYDYKDGGITPNDMVEIINEIKKYIDIVHVSTGGLISVEINAY